MSKHPSIVKAAGERLQAMTAYGESKRAAKAEVRKAALDAGKTPTWSVSSGRIHAEKTEQAYWRVVREYVIWARSSSGVTRLGDLDARADELASAFLVGKIAAGKADGAPYSAWTLAVYRSALRMFHNQRDLASAVELPKRRRQDIRHNRALSAHAQGHVDEERHADLIAFLSGSGLRRDEATRLRVGDVAITRGAEGASVAAQIHVRQGKGGRERVVQYIGDPERLSTLARGKQLEERLFGHIHEGLQTHRLRRAFAQDLYRRLSGRELPPAKGRLTRGSYDPLAVGEVSRQLGHSRRDVVLTHYLR